MKRKPVVLAALFMIAVIVSAEYATVADRVACAASGWSARGGAHALASAGVTTARLFVRAVVCAAER